MTVRLRDPEKIKQNYFACLPDEITTKVLSSVHSEKPLTSYLSTLPCVCKVWGNCIADVTVNLMNDNKLSIEHVPFVYRGKDNPTLSTLYIYQYLKHLKNPLTTLDLSPLYLFHLEQFEEFKDLFSKVKVLSRYLFSTYKDNMILPMFSHVKRLHFAPNQFSDLSFKYMPEMEALSLFFGHQEVVNGCSHALSECTTISTLCLSANSPCERFSFPDSFRLPSQLKELTLNNFVFELDIFSNCTQIERLYIKHAEPPPSFKIFEHLKLLSIEYIPHARVMTLKDLKVNELVIESINLQKLNLDQVSYQSLSSSSLRLSQINVVHFPP